MSIEYKVVVDDHGTQRWFRNDQLHREDGPAVIGANGYQAWCLNGKYHREDGPAIIWADGTKKWFLNGELLTEQQFNNRNRPCLGKVVVVDGIEYTLS